MPGIAMLSSIKRGTGAIGGPPRGHSQLQEIWLQVQDPNAHMPKRVPQERSNEERLKILSDQEKRDELARIATIRRARSNFHPSEGLMRRRTGEAMPREEREEARERLYRSTSPPRAKTPTNQGHLLDTGEMAIASPVKVELAREQPKPRLRARSAPIKDEPTWMGLSGRKGQPAVLPTLGGKPPPESTVASVDGSGILLDENWEETEGAKNGAERSSRPQVKPQPVYQSLTARAYFQDAGWKPGDSYAKYKPAKHPAEWANLDGFARMSRSYEIHHMNTFADITAFSSGGYHPEAYVRPMDVKGQLGASSIQQWKEMLRQDFAQRSDTWQSEDDAQIEELRKLLKAGNGVQLDA